MNIFSPETRTSEASRSSNVRTMRFNASISHVTAGLTLLGSEMLGLSRDTVVLMPVGSGMLGLPRDTAVLTPVDSGMPGPTRDGEPTTVSHTHRHATTS